MLRLLLRCLLVLVLSVSVGCGLRGLWQAVLVPLPVPSPTGWRLQGMSW